MQCQNGICIFTKFIFDIASKEIIIPLQKTWKTSINLLIKLRGRYIITEFLGYINILNGTQYSIIGPKIDYHPFFNRSRIENIL